jgi:hypothetical protein
LGEMESLCHITGAGILVCADSPRTAALCTARVIGGAVDVFRRHINGIIDTWCPGGGNEAGVTKPCANLVRHW